MPQVACPILQIHGAQDTIIPIPLGRRLFDAAPARSKNGVAKRFIELPRADHNDILVVAQGQIRLVLQQFFQEIGVGAR
jgi:pimeloyl-ACP methyl ester carboxylesterase